MVEKKYKWTAGAKLDEHSRCKHEILRKYFFDYLTVRCRLPQMERFRLAVVEGFAGGGRYECGTAGSPLIFIEELMHASQSVNARRGQQGLGAIEIECLLILNDADEDAVELLKTHVAPLQMQIAQTVPKLHLRVEYLSNSFEQVYPEIKHHLKQGKYGNVVFNLDQSGYSHVDWSTIRDIICSYRSVEVFYTFMISSLLAFLEKNNPQRLLTRLSYLGLRESDLKRLEGVMNRKEWLGVAEQIVFDTFGTYAPFVSPFSINNPDGWRYWLIHFANNYRARQVYNKVLHDNSTLQAHFGRSGLNMLSYDPSHEDGRLYLFDVSGRAAAKEQLMDDIPRLVSESGDAMAVEEFYEGIYNITPAHTDDVHSAIIDNPDLEVTTPAGGERRKANTIGVGDVLRVKTQRSFFPMFSDKGDKRDSGDGNA